MKGETYFFKATSLLYFLAFSLFSLSLVPHFSFMVLISQKKEEEYKRKSKALIEKCRPFLCQK